MYLIDIEVENLRSIARMKIDLRPGITGLLGPNGSGKTSFLTALAFAITGAVIGDSTKQELLRWGTDKGFAKLRFRVTQADPRVFVIKRNIHGSTVDLREEGASKPAFSSREGIDKFMHDLINLHPRLYDKILFIEQEGLDTLLMDNRHTKRVEFFNDIFDASITEKLRELIQRYLQQIPDMADM